MSSSPAGAPSARIPLTCFSTDGIAYFFANSAICAFVGLLFWPANSFLPCASSSLLPWAQMALPLRRNSAFVILLEPLSPPVAALTG